MASLFFVTGLGLQVDKTMILPGSTLKLSRAAPGHWTRFGTSAMAAAERQMTVATPGAANTADDDDDDEDDDITAEDVLEMPKDDVTARLDRLGVNHDKRKSEDSLRELLIDKLA